MLKIGLNMLSKRRIRQRIFQSSKEANIARPHETSIILIWESEIRSLACESAQWSIETGGDLFGRWDGKPVVYLATRAGPKAVRDRTHFGLDVDYLRSISDCLAVEWDLRYLGDWHSHHRLQLPRPSSGDVTRISRLSKRNGFDAMAEIITTLEGDERTPNVAVHPWIYTRSDSNERPMRARLEIVRGVSPVREALIESGVLPDQQFSQWDRIEFGRLRVGADGLQPELGNGPDGDPFVSDKAFLRVQSALEKASGHSVEHHLTSFGRIIAVRAGEGGLVGIAIDGRWPHAVLEVDWIDREQRTTEPLSLRLPSSALSPEKLADVYREARSLKLDGKLRVDNGTA